MTTAAHVPDLHVNSLTYRLRECESVTFIGPPPAINFETDEASFTLDAGKLICNMKLHFARVHEARAAVEPILRAWEVDSDLRGNRNALRFDYEASDIVDRAPVRPGEAHVYVHAVESGDVAVSSGSATFHLSTKQYPEPPGPFRLNPDGESMLLRYNGYLDGCEPLPAMAYFCLTVVQGIAGRRAAAKQYRRQCNLGTFLRGRYCSQNAAFGL